MSNYIGVDGGVIVGGNPQVSQSTKTKHKQIVSAEASLSSIATHVTFLMILWQKYTNKNFKVIVATFYKNSEGIYIFLFKIVQLFITL